MKIQIENLDKIYNNGKRALSDVNLEIENGMSHELPNANTLDAALTFLAGE